MEWMDEEKPVERTFGLVKATGTQEEIKSMEKFWDDMKHLRSEWKGYPGLLELGYYYNLSQVYIHMPKSRTEADDEIETWKVLKKNLEKEYLETPAAIKEATESYMKAAKEFMMMPGVEDMLKSDDMELDDDVKEAMLELIQLHKEESDAKENKMEEDSKDTKNLCKSLEGKELPNTKEMMLEQDSKELKKQFESLVKLNLKFYEQTKRRSQIKSYIARIELLIDYLRSNHPKHDRQIKEETKQSAENKRSGSQVEGSEQKHRCLRP